MRYKLSVPAVLIVVFVVGVCAVFAWSDGAYSSSPPQGIIDTVAGGGSGCTEPCPATSAALQPPYDVERDMWGNLYVADYGNARVRKVDNAGILTIVAGNGSPGVEGDGGLATSAQVGNPHAVAADHQGNLYIAQYGPQRVRKVNTSGVISTIAGGGGGCGRPCLATSAALDYPSGMTIDASGNLFIAEQGGLVSKVDSSGIISTVAGGGLGCTEPCPATQASLNSTTPTDLSLDSSGNLYIAEYSGNVRKVDPSGIITTVVNLGADAVEVDAWDNLYIATGCRIVKRAPGGDVSTVAGSNSECGFSGDGGPATDALMGTAAGVAPGSSGGFYIADNGNNRIREVGGSFVGGIAEYPQLEPSATSDVGGSSGPNALSPAGLATVAALLLAAGAWYARRRWRAG